ncbi:MAG: hypothetical protein ACFFBP_01555 [Promethearchaeota archaeon]
MGHVEPYFEIDKKGRVICKLHSNYDHIKSLCETYTQDVRCDQNLTCKTCSSYTNDECYFQKSRIDEIEHDRLKKKDYACKLCGNRIHRMWTVIYSIYYKEKFNIKIPLLCCSCYDSLKNETFMDKYKTRTFSIKFYLILSILIIIDSLFYIDPFYLVFSIINICFAVFCVIIYVKYLKKLKKGRDYYQEHFMKEQP